MHKRVVSVRRGGVVWVRTRSREATQRAGGGETFLFYHTRVKSILTMVARWR